MNDSPNHFDLIGYLEEALAPEEMTRIEELLRSSDSWREALLDVLDAVETDEHSVATIWRRHRLSCPNREKLGTYLLGGLLPEEEDYIRFHLEVLRCRRCSANLGDLGIVARDEGADVTKRRRRIFQSSVGRLPKVKQL